MKTDNVRGELRRRSRILFLSVLGSVICLVGVCASWQAGQRDVEVRERAWDIVMERYWPNPAHRMVFEGAVEEFDLPWSLAQAVCQVESDGDQYAYSSKGARGYYQLMWRTAQDLCRENSMEYRGKTSIYDGGNNIYNGLQYLRGCLDRYGEKLGIEMYNVGHGNYFSKGIRNSSYVEDVLTEQESIEREFTELVKALRAKGKNNRR